jgi:hypothetical protein
MSCENEYEYTEKNKSTEPVRCWGGGHINRHSNIHF